MKLAIDWTRCDGHRLCTAVLPELLGVDDWGYPVLKADRVPERMGPEARRAVMLCPALALRLEEEPARSR